MLSIFKYLSLGGVLWYSSFAFGQTFPSVNNSAQQQQLADMVVLVEQLSQEVRELRGVVEEQSYELRKIQQQRMDDYRSLDQRIADLSVGGVSVVGTSSSNTNGTEDNSIPTVLASNDPGSAVAPPALSEKETYRQAYTLVKNREFDAAVGAFDSFLVQFPSGSYAGNAHYWLGELYDLRSDYTNAQKSMLALIAQFPEHRKVPDAHYKLAKVYHKMGGAEKAIEHANIVIAQYSRKASTTAKLTQEFLAKNYPNPSN